jgi:tripartite-type tricarboxylate transporter receptor subunit TctC
VEGAYYPGAAGRVGYEKYMGLAKEDCYDLMFGNMGPEVLNWVVEAPTFNLDDYFYFTQLDADPGILFVAANSKLQTIDDIIAEGKKRTLNVGVSRLAHPASLGALAVARHSGAKFTLVPLSRSSLMTKTPCPMSWTTRPPQTDILAQRFHRWSPELAHLPSRKPLLMHIRTATSFYCRP